MRPWPVAPMTSQFFHDPGLVPGLDCYVYVLRGHIKLVLSRPRAFYTLQSFAYQAPK